ncbi:MAG: hypothetical protein AAGD01_17735 [Acidobacteriota bacterium]
MQNQQQFSDDKAVQVFPFSRQESHGEVIIGRQDTGTYLALPLEAVEILDDLSTGKTIGQTRHLYQQRHGENPDLEDFLDSLAQQGFLVPAGSEKTSEHQIEPNANYHFESIPQSTASILFGIPALTFYALLTLTALALAFREPSIVPGYRALIFDQYITIKLVAIIVSSLFTVFIHEMGHLIAAKAVGVNSRLGIGNRMWVIVAETDLTGLWAVPRHKRFLPMLAGPIIDLVSASLLLFIFYAEHSEWLTLPTLASEMLRALFIVYVLQILWQLLFFLRTDLYYVFTTALDCKDLMNDTTNYLKNLAAQLFPPLRKMNWWRTSDQSHIPKRELQVIKFYAGFWLLSRIMALGFLIFISIPLFIEYLGVVTSNLRQGPKEDIITFLDAALISALSATLFLAGMIAWIRSLLTKRSHIG